MKKTDPRQLEFDFSYRKPALVQCEHSFETDDITDHEWCRKCGLVIPHDYIADTIGVAEWDSYV